jgi:hypothetical protein
MLSYMRDHRSNPQFDCERHPIAEFTAIGGDFAKVG